MIPTRLQVQTRFNAILDDVTASTFTDAVFTEAFGEAFDALFGGLLQAQAPRIQIISTHTLNANTTSLTPAAAGIADFADIDELEERLSGSTDNYTDVHQVGKLSQRAAGDKLLEFVWRFDTFYFVGATTTRQLRLTYLTSGTAPTADGDVINVDGCETFLSKAAIAACGFRKGYEEIADMCRLQAYGPKYDQGVIGGELFRLVQSRVRSMQNVQVAQKMYGSYGRTRHRAVPYVASQQPAGSGVAPIQFSHFSGNITGTIDGVNDTFFLSFPVTSVAVILNGSTLTPTQHYSHGANVVTFVPPFIPQPGADILVEGWL